MAIQYTYTRNATDIDGNIIEITVTNGTTAAWGSYLLAATYTYVDSTATPINTSIYLTEQTGTALLAGSSIAISLPISTATFNSTLASNLLVGASFPATLTSVAS